MRMLKKGQGTTEYLLIVAAVLTIVVIGVYYLSSTSSGPTLSFTAENVADTVVLTFTSGTSTVTSDWEYVIVEAGQTMSMSSWTTNSTDILAGSTISVSAPTADTGDIFRIRIGTIIFNQNII
ncbi:MAG: class III signal peptide-containing protein [Candidatus Hadarchaeota archaeon]